MTANPPTLYKKYYIDRKEEKLDLFKLLVNKYKIKKAIYPGSYLHFTPSFIIPDVVYIDQNKDAFKVFGETITKDYTDSRKLYREEANYKFMFNSYKGNLEIKNNSFDLLISQFAGFVSKYCTKYLKLGGILLVNDSHADASLAYLSSQYELIGVVDRLDGKYSMITNSLDKYFIMKSGAKITKKELLEAQKGPRYLEIADNYIFKRIK